MTTLPINSIIVGKRHRRDLGDIEGFARRIADLGVLMHPIVVRPDGRLIAGERRLHACRAAGWTDVPVTIVDLANIVAGEAAENFDRKDFTPSEAVAIKRELEPELKAAAAARMKVGRPSANFAGGGEARQKAAGFTGYSHETLRKAEAIVEAAEAEPERFGKLAEDMDRTGRVDGVFRRLFNMRQADRIRAEPPPLPTGPFRVVVADPPWPYELRAEDPSHRGVHPYSTMSLAEICALPVLKLAHDDAILWLWTTNHHIFEAPHVLSAWGFEHKTILTWAKDRFGFGDWLRGQTEHAIMAVRGSPVVRLTNQSTALLAPMRAHSQKPEEFYAIVESLCPAPEGGRLEMFAREARPGWIAWGGEAPREAEIEEEPPTPPPESPYPAPSPVPIQPPVKREPYDIGDIPAFLRRDRPAPESPA